MALIPWGDFRPDVSDYQGTHTISVTNVVPQGDGYGPFQDLVAYTDALPAECRGYFVANRSDGTVEIFAGTSTKLYQLNKTTLAWTNVSKSSGTHNYSVPTDDQWSFQQVGDVVLASNINVVIQAFTMGSSTYFADVSGSPQCQRMIIINQFVVALGISGNRDKVEWSARGDYTGWTAGTNEAGEETFVDGGIVLNGAGGEFSGLIMQKQAVRRLTYQPGAPTVFSFDRIKQLSGLAAPLMIAGDDERTFYYSTRGFQMVPAGASAAVPIGTERVDRYFKSIWDSAEPRVAMAAIDPTAHVVYFGFKSNQGQTGRLDTLLCYNWALERWSPVSSIVAEFLGPFSQPGTTLEGLDAQFPSIDDMAISLDAIPLAAAPELGLVTTDHELGFLRGSNLEAVFETSERSLEFKRAFISGMRPATDAATVYGNVSSRNDLSDGVTYTLEQQKQSDGFLPARRDVRYFRLRNRIPAGTTWTYHMGVEPELQETGED